MAVQVSRKGVARSGAWRYMTSTDSTLRASSERSMDVAMFLALWLPGMKDVTFVETLAHLLRRRVSSPRSFSHVPPRPTG